MRFAVLSVPAVLFSCAWPLFAQLPLHDVAPVSRNVWTVNAAGGGDFTDLPPAVLAARSGDVLLVAPGDYTSFALHGKGLTILGEGGVPRVTGAPIEVTDLAANQSLVLRGLEIERLADSGDALLGLFDENAGTIWIEDCTFNFAGTTGSEDGLLFEDCAAVVLVRIEAVCQTSFHPFQEKAQALHAVRSDVHAFDSTFRAVLTLNFGTGGDNGATLENSFLYAAGCTFEGGKGWRSTCSGLTFCSSPGGPGGTGLDATAAGTPPITLACMFLGGLPGGQGPGCACPTPPPGVPMEGDVVEEDLPLRSYELSTPAHGGTSYQLTAHCQPGEFVWSVFAARPEPLYVPNYFGTQIGALPVTLVSEGVAGPSGTVTKSVPVPPLAALTGFERVWAQGLFFDALQNAYLGTPSVLVLVP